MSTMRCVPQSIRVITPTGGLQKREVNFFSVDRFGGVPPPLASRSTSYVALLNPAYEGARLGTRQVQHTLSLSTQVPSGGRSPQKVLSMIPFVRRHCGYERARVLESRVVKCVTYVIPARCLLTQRLESYMKLEGAES